MRCFAVFVCVFLAFFTKQHKTDQKIYKTHKTNKIRFVQYSAIRCYASFSHSVNVYKKLSQNTSKTLQNIRKTPQNTAKHCFSKNTRKTPQNTRKTPQNIAKHHKIDLLTKQTELANKPLRSHTRHACSLLLSRRGHFRTSCAEQGRVGARASWRSVLRGRRNEHHRFTPWAARRLVGLGR